MYSGHGGADPPEPPSDYGTLILHTDPDVIEEDYYDNVFVADVEPFVNKGGKLFVFVESCASGGFGEKLMGLSDATNIYCVAACDIDGYSQEVDDTGKIRYPRGKKFIAVNGMATWAFLEYSWKTQFNNEPHTACEDIFPVGYDKVQSENSKYYKRYPEDFPQEFDGDPTSYYYID